MVEGRTGSKLALLVLKLSTTLEWPESPRVGLTAERSML